jgi:hypothetical protein
VRDAILARHPAAILHRRPRARIARLAHAEILTPVTLREASWGDFAPLGALRRYEDRHTRDHGNAGPNTWGYFGYREGRGDIPAFRLIVAAARPG